MAIISNWKQKALILTKRKVWLASEEFEIPWLFGGILLVNKHCYVHGFEHDKHRWIHVESHQFEFIIVLTSDELFIFFIALLAVSNQAGPVQTGL